MTTKKRMAKLLMCIGEQEQSLEQARQALCNCLQFEPYTAFKRLDRNGQGYITVYDVLEFARYVFIVLKLKREPNGCRHRS